MAAQISISIIKQFHINPRTFCSLKLLTDSTIDIASEPIAHNAPTLPRIMKRFISSDPYISYS